MTTSPPAVLPDAAHTPAGTRAGNSWIIKLSIFLAIILLLLAVAALWIFLHLGTWLVVQDPLSPAEIIVVLSGHMPDRAVEAAHLYAQKAATEVWVTQPMRPPELAAMNIPFVGEDFYSQRVLMAMNVPALSIRILPDPILNTQQEIEEIGRIARESNFHTVVIVTSAPHTRRVRAIWNKLIGDSPRLIVRHPVDDPFDATQWWSETQDALDVVREWLGLANAWAGFPLRPGYH